MIRPEAASDALGPREKHVLWTLLKFSIAMALVPISSFFLSKKFLFEDVLGYSNGAIGAAVMTVVIIHVIIGLYISVAIKEESEEKKKE